MKLEAVSISKIKNDLGKWATVCLVSSVALGMSFALVAVNSTEINNFDRQPSCSPAVVVSTNIESGKTCTSCHQWRCSSEYHRNSSKSDQLESHCKSCVSRRKELKRLAARRLERKCEAFTSVIVGGLNPDAIQRFAGVFGAAAKEVLDDSKEKAH